MSPLNFHVGAQRPSTQERSGYKSTLNGDNSGYFSRKFQQIRREGITNMFKRLRYFRFSLIVVAVLALSTLIVPGGAQAQDFEPMIYAAPENC